ncbi:MAG: hypothetical protein SFX72_15295 [Isosphaeraceae bacterium]|nr:hypothetical protein [Isosphaeraceae bacterium]
MSDERLTNPDEPEFDRGVQPEDLCHIDRRSGYDRRNQQVARPEHLEQRKNPDRRKKLKGVDPTTSDISYTKEEVEFATLVARRRQFSGQAWLTYREVFEILYHDLGYRKVGFDSAETLPSPHFSTTAVDDEDAFGEE